MNAENIYKKNEQKLENALAAKEAKRLNEAAVLFDEIIEDLKKIEDIDVKYTIDLNKEFREKYEEILQYSIETKKEIQSQMLEKIDFFKKENKIPMVVEHYEILLNLAREIGEDDKKIEGYQEDYDNYRKKLFEKILETIQDLINDANEKKNSGNFSEAKELFENALKMACDVNHEDLIWALTEQVKLINNIYLKEKRKKHLEMAKNAIENENFPLAISLYRISSKYSTELGDLDQVKEFDLEIKKLEKSKIAYEKQRKKIEEKIVTLLEKGDQFHDKNGFFEAIKLFSEALELHPTNPEDIEKKINDSYLSYITNLFFNKKLPKNIKDVISIANELSLNQGKISISDLYKRAVKRLLIPKEHIASVIYFLHKIRILF